MTVLVVGAATSGRAAASLLLSLGEKVAVYDAEAAAVAGIGVDEKFSGAWSEGYLDGIDLVVTSPGVLPTAPPLADASRRGIPIWSEIELAYRHLGVPLGAVTATNGKTTVTEAAAAMLQASGMATTAVGNIGEPLCGAVGGEWDVLVVEASSFQLAFIERFHATGAVLLNIAPDHLDWHGSFGAYVGAKRRILERQTGEDVVIHDADDPEATAAVAGATGRTVPVSGTHLPPGGSGRHGEVVRIREIEMPVSMLARHDDSFLVDIVAAAELAFHLGAGPDGVLSAAAAYAPGRHRREVVAERLGVTWVDDSKATNPHAAIAAIRSYPSVVLIAGGRPKGLDVSSLALEPNLRHLVGIGEAGPALVEASPAGTLVADMGEAVELAARLARRGDTVLLAPGCASFDMFSSYAERGDRFREAVLALGGG